VEASTPNQSAFFTNYVTISNPSESDQHFITQPNNVMIVSGRTNVSSVGQTAINAFTAVANQPFRFVYAYKADDFAACGNGGTVFTDTSGVLPVVSQMIIGGRNVLPKSCAFRRLTYFPKRLSNSQLQALST